jgi:hypothetical protein
MAALDFLNPMGGNKDYLADLSAGDKSVLNAGKTRRQALLRDSQRLASGDLGMSNAEKQQMIDTAARQTGAALEAQGQELGQMALAAGPRDVGRFAKLQREIGQQGLATAMSQATGEAERISQAKAEAEKQSIEAALERQQQLSWQKQQYYTNLLFDKVPALVGQIISLVG